MVDPSEPGSRDGRWMLWLGAAQAVGTWIVLGLSAWSFVKGALARMAINPPQPNPNVPVQPTPLWTELAVDVGGLGLLFGPLGCAIVGLAWGTATIARVPRWRWAALAIAAVAVAPAVLQAVVFTLAAIPLLL